MKYYCLSHSNDEFTIIRTNDKEEIDILKSAIIISPDNTLQVNGRNVVEVEEISKDQYENEMIMKGINNDF